MITILCIGKIKEAYLNNLINDYYTRIKKYHKIQIIELKDEDDANKELISVKKYLNEKDYNIAMDINGEIYSSEKLAQSITSIFNYNSNITFIIGSSLGIHQEILNKCNLKISFSKMTFPHGLFRGILLEQIYRAFKINNNESYHK